MSGQVHAGCVTRDVCVHVQYNGATTQTCDDAARQQEAANATQVYITAIQRNITPRYAHVVLHAPISVEPRGFPRGQ